MKKITLITAILFSLVATSQKYVDLEKELANVEGHLLIDGAELQHKYNTKEQIVVTGNNLVFRDRSSIVLRNVIIQLSGDIKVKGAIKPRLLDSYIICRDAGGLKSKNILEIGSRRAGNFSKTKFYQTLDTNNEIWIYNTAGKRLFKGSKESLATVKLPLSRYDVKIVGERFINNVLIY